MITASTRLGLLFGIAALMGCYESGNDGADNGPGEDRRPNHQAPRFEVQGDGTVVDESVGLVWMRCPLGLSGEACEQGTLTMVDADEAASACARADVGGHQDWRLPKTPELVRLVDYARAAPSIDEEIFPGTPADSFLSVEGPSGLPASVSFYRGEVYGHSDRFLRLVRCVRGEPLGAGPLSAVSTDQQADPETVLQDQATGLIWMPCPADYVLAEPPSSVDLPPDWPELRCQYVGGSKGIVEYYQGEVHDYWEAHEYCWRLSYGGFDDWRLPTVSEVLSLPLDDYRASPLTDLLYPGGPPVWTAEPIDEQLGLGYAASVDNGFSVEHAVLDDDRFAMLCVR